MDFALMRMPVWTYLAISISILFNVAFAQPDVLGELNQTVKNLNFKFQGEPYNLVDVPYQLHVELTYKDDAPSGIYSPYSRLYRDGEIKIRYDRAGDPLVITHEYIHALMERVQPKGVIARGPQRRAIEEGVAQYLACSIHDVAQYDFLTEKVNLTQMKLSYPQDYKFDSYKDSRIVMNALWDLRAVLGKDKADFLLVEALKEPLNGFSNLLTAMLKSNDRYNGNWNEAVHDDPAATTIAAIFEKHGIEEDTTETNYAAVPVQTRYYLTSVKGGAVDFKVQYQNTGPAPWNAQGYDRGGDSVAPRAVWLTKVDTNQLGYDSSDTKKVCTLNEDQVGMGQSGSFSIKMAAPSQSGTYTYTYQPMAYLSQYVYDPSEAPVVKMGEPITVVVKVI